VSPLGWFLLLLAVVAVVAIGAVASRSRRAAVSRGRREEPPAPPVLPPSNDLSTLGLSEVRARPAAVRPDADAARYEDLPRSRASEPSRPPASADDARSARVEDDGPWAESPVRYLLRSLAAHVGGPVAVVRHDGARFQVAARTDGGPRTPVLGTPLSLDGATDLDRAVLGGLAALVGAEARAVPLGAYVVLIGGSGKAAAGYLGLLAALTGASPSEDPDGDPKAGSRRRKRAGTPKKKAAEAPNIPDAAPVPRAAIIEEEQAAARQAGRPLAFALITLADAEEQLTRGTPEAVAAAEADLRDRLASAPDVRRVEPFGDLLFGVFLDLEASPTAAWCDRLASGDPPLFIGAVAPADGDPTGIRNAAAEALHDAYDQRRARVVEA